MQVVFGRARNSRAYERMYRNESRAEVLCEFGRGIEWIEEGWKRW